MILKSNLSGAKNRHFRQGWEMISRRRGPQAGFSSEKSVLKNPDSGYVENQTKSTGTILL